MFKTRKIVQGRQQGLFRAVRALDGSAILRRAVCLAMFGVVASFGVACADSSDYLYRPAENATAVADGHAAARYTIPVAAPKGDVRIASFGVHGVKQENGPEWPALHVRMIVANDAGNAAWTVDSREIRVEVRGEKPKDPAAVNADVSDMPLIRIPPGEQRTLDLFYPLADEYDDATSIPAFDVLWKVETDTEIVAERTPFERVAMQRAPTTTWGMGYSPYWWSNPWYPGMSPLAGPGMVGPGMMAPGPVISPRIYIHAHPGLHH